MADTNQILSTKALKFWRWFDIISADLLLNPTRSDLVSQIDNRVSQLGPFDWEIGPSENGLFFFSISPNLDIDRLELTREIIALAPICPGWCFLPSKPPKTGWLGIWKMKNDFGSEIRVESSNWKYVLYQFEDGTFDMDIAIDNIEGDLNTCYLAVDIALTGYLGEELFMKFIQHINIVNAFGDEFEGSRLKNIKKHIERVLASN